MTETPLKKLIDAARVKMGSFDRPVTVADVLQELNFVRYKAGRPTVSRSALCAWIGVTAKGRGVFKPADKQTADDLVKALRKLGMKTTVSELWPGAVWRAKP